MIRLPLLMILCSAPTLACLWDYDTLRDEKRGLPGIAETLAGKWEKHSPFFYEHRVERMLELLERQPHNLDAWDNLAVAYEKLGDHDQAIETILKKDAIAPGQYTTHANLGTFYLHKGDFENGIRHIRRALEINPDAHFGREEYQLQLAEYLWTIRQSDTPPPLEDFLGISLFQQAPDDRIYPVDLFRGSPERLKEQGLKDNVFDGIVGMIRFGTGRSPDLYYALGNLLTLRGDKHLAYRAYQRAIDLGHPHSDSIEQLQETLAGYIENQRDLAPEVIANERAEAEAWVKAYQEFEDDLIRSGLDPHDEANFDAFYREHGHATPAQAATIADWLPRRPETRHFIIASAVAIILFAAIAIFRRRHHQHPRP